jgi:formate-dependent nitrite reductase membrane component NrfD
MKNRVYAVVGLVAAIGLLIFAMLDFAAGDSGAGVRELVYAAIAGLASGFLFSRDGKPAQGR